MRLGEMLSVVMKQKFAEVVFLLSLPWVPEVIFFVWRREITRRSRFFRDNLFLSTGLWILGILRLAIMLNRSPEISLSRGYNIPCNWQPWHCYFCAITLPYQCTTIERPIQGCVQCTWLFVILHLFCSWQKWPYLSVCSGFLLATRFVLPRRLGAWHDFSFVKTPLLRFGFHMTS